MNEKEMREKINEIVERFEECITNNDKAIIVVSAFMTMLGHYCVAKEDPIAVCQAICKQLLYNVENATKIMKEEENA